LRDLGDVIDEHHAEVAEPVDDLTVVDDLVVAVHGRLERPHHPGQRLDRHLDAGAEPARRGEEDLVDRHRPSVPTAWVDLAGGRRAGQPEASGSARAKARRWVPDSEPIDLEPWN